MWAAMIALRQGRLHDVPTYMGDILNSQSSNPVFIQRLMVALYGEANAKLLGSSIAAIGHLSIGQFDTAAQDADKVISIVPNYAEMYLLKGLSYCNIDENKKAEEAYSAGLKVDPSFSMLYFLRAEVRSKLGDTIGAAEDLDIVGKSDISANLKPYIEAAQAGQFSCKDITTSK